MQQANTQGRPKHKGQPRETEIDILYENERGGFLCGSALFSAKALGGLDATPWSELNPAWIMLLPTMKKTRRY